MRKGSFCLLKPGAIAAVVVNYDGWDDVLSCVASLRASYGDLIYVTIVDNSDVPTQVPEDVRLDLKADVITGFGNVGYAAGCNTGIARCIDRGHDYIWLLNPDTRVEPGTLPTLLEVFADLPDCGVVGPRILLPGTPGTIWFDGGQVDLRKHGETSHLHQGVPVFAAPPAQRLDVDYITGASLLVRREVIETVGPMPEDYFLYFEETDWCHRIRTAGWRVVVEQHATMTHYKRSSGSIPSPYHLYYMLRNRYFFVQRSLNGDPEAALRQMLRTWVRVWRKSVRRHAPNLLDEFDALVERAVTDARAGRDGRCDDVSHMAWRTSTRT